MSVPAAYLGVILIWSTTPLTVQWSTDGVSFMFGLTARIAIGVMLCLLLMIALRVRLPWQRQALRAYAAAALGVYASMTLVYAAAPMVPSGLISVLFGLTPLLTSVLGVLWLSEPGLTAGKLGGIALAIAGLAVIFSADLGPYPRAGLGILLLLAAVALHGLSLVLVKRSGASLHPLAQATGGMLLALPCYALTWPLLGEPVWPAQIPPRAAAAILYLAAFGSVAGFTLYYYALKRLSATAMAMITLITPVMALQLGLWLNGEPVTASVWAGTAVILAGLGLHQWDGRTRRAEGAGKLPAV